MEEEERVSDRLERWTKAEGDKTVGGLIDVFEEKSFAVLFLILLGVPALPLPTGGATHVFEVIAVLLALQLIVGRDEIWLPERWRAKELAGERQQKFIAGLLRFMRRLERYSRPRLRFLFDRRLTNMICGLVIAGLSVAAFFAPPFTGLDTLPALGAVIISVGVLLEDALMVLVGLIVGAAGVLLEIFVGAKAFDAIKDLFT